MRNLGYVFILLALNFYAQNDLDAIRYSRLGVNGTSRFTSMGGAFGALGADLSCASYNPAGLGLFRKGEASFGGGLRISNNQGTINGKNSSVADANIVFNNFGFLLSWPSQNDNESRHAFGFTNMQLQNFSNKVRFSNYTTNSIAKDMLNLAQEKQNVSALTGNYEYMGFQTYLLDTIIVQGKTQFFSFVDLKRNVLQTRDIVTSGRLNDINFSYAYSYKDQFYLGASLGIPRVSYTSTTTHTESDDKDSMKIVITSPPGSPTTYSTTYLQEPPFIYTDKLGFNSLSYVEYFNTTGRGVNLKLGGVVRVNDNVRIGLYFHSPTLYNLEDRYFNSISVTFDKDTKTPTTYQDPAKGGYYKYKINTPSKFGLNAGFVIGKIAAIGLDYELINYKNAQLSSNNISDFAGVNAVIKQKYAVASNVRAGIEFNLNPLFLRAGYNMQGSPFGNTFSGSFVRNTFSLGVGFRTKNNIFFDFVWFKTYSNETYYMFNTIPQKATLDYKNSQLAVTVGFKF
ncbi:MAG: outer membrane protein transport protein [Bacteroidetes bacterium]|nr:outer membrane protein transport protein [Bacteroidota bacterium]